MFLFPVKLLSAPAKDILGLTVPRRLGRKRASNIRKLYNLTMENDFHRFGVKRPLPEINVKKAESEALKNQRLIRWVILQCKTHHLVLLSRQRRIRHRSSLPSMWDSRSSGGSEKKGTVAVKDEKAKTCMLMQRMLDVVPSVVSR